MMHSNAVAALGSPLGLDLTASTRQRRKQKLKEEGFEGILAQAGCEPISYWGKRFLEAGEVRGGIFPKMCYILYGPEIGLTLFFVGAALCVFLGVIGVSTLNINSLVGAAAALYFTGLLMRLLDKFPSWQNSVIRWTSTHVITPDNAVVEIPFSARRKMEKIHKLSPRAEFLARSHADDPFILVRDPVSGKLYTIAHF